MTSRVGKLGLALAGVLLATAAHAQDRGPRQKSVVASQVGAGEASRIQAERNQLFQHMLQKPDDLDAAFKYAALSAQVGDLEAAVSTLERMLIFAPGLPRLQLELGVLYYRMSAFETARGYFEAAVSGPDVPPEVRARVDQYVGGIDKAADPSRFTGQIRTGIRYQTNANRAPVDATIFLNGLPFRLSPGSTGEADGNVYVGGVLHHSYDLESQGDTLETDLVYYASKQFERDELDVAVAELTIGPAFDMGRFGMDNAALGIYGIVSGVYLGDHFYSSAFGVGSRFVVRPNPATSLLAAVEYRARDYRDSSSAPTASLRDGDELRVLGNATYIFSPTMLVSGSAYVQRTSADRGFFSYTEGGFTVGPRYAFASPVSADMPAWTLAVNAGALWRNYDDPDPVISRTLAEEDWEAFIGAGLTVPLKNQFAVISEVEYRHTDSNYDLRNFDNVSVSLSLAKSF